MEAPNTSWVIPESSLDFAFGFDDPKYSDRTLQLQIIDHAHTDGDNCSDLVRNVKRCRRCTDLRIAASTAPPPRMKTIHINSMILAARSPFFLKWGSGKCRVKYEVALRKKPSEEFGSWATGSVIFPESKCSKMLYGVPCTGFIEGDSPYFYVLHDFTMLSV